MAPSVEETVAGHIATVYSFAGGTYVYVEKGCKFTMSSYSAKKEHAETGAVSDPALDDVMKHQKMKDAMVGVPEDIDEISQDPGWAYSSSAAVDVSDYFPPDKDDKLFEYHHSFPGSSIRPSKLGIVGKLVLVAQYGDVGKGYAKDLKEAGIRVIVAETDPNRAHQATKDGFQVLPLDDVVSQVDIFVFTTDDKDITVMDNILKMKNNAIICNIGHIDNKIDMFDLEAFPGTKKITINPQTDWWIFPDTGKSLIIRAGILIMNQADNICVRAESPPKPVQGYGPRQCLLDSLIVIRIFVLVFLFVKSVANW